MSVAVSSIMGLTRILFSVASNFDKFVQQGAQPDPSCTCWKSILCSYVPNSYKLLYVLTPGILYLFSGVMALTEKMDYMLFTWVGIKLWVTYWFMLWGFLDPSWYQRIFWPHNLIFFSFAICQLFWPKHVLRLCCWVISYTKHVGARVVFYGAYIWGAIVA